MVAVDIPELLYTPVDDISRRVGKVRAAFHEHKTRSLEFRLLQLRKLYWAIKDREAQIAEACSRDLGKPLFEAHLADIGWVENDIVFVTKHLAKWMKDEKAQDIDLTNSFVSPKIRKDPLGCVLVIGAFNFPFQLTLGPLIGAIAGGNSVVIKPSEAASNSAAVLQDIIESSLDPSCYTVIQGSIPESQALLAEHWDKIFFTGSANVGRIVAKAAAPNLTPVTLELGGRNPAIITKRADPRLAARRLLWGKILNAGQVCISQNYILVDKEVVPTLVAEFEKAYKEYYPKGAQVSPDFARIINDDSFVRLKKMLDNTKGKILMGGTMDEKTRFIEPTLVQVDSVDDSLIAEESFGPFIPILPVANLDEAIKIANEVHSTPLGIYAFGSKEETDRILASTRSGGASVNDAFFHGSIPTLPFGGVGDSGSGSYRGRASFDCFTHRRSVTTTPSWLEKMLAIRYPPYAGKLSKFQAASTLKPNFDRNGRKTGGGLFGWITWLVTFGGGANKSGAARTAAVVIDKEDGEENTQAAPPPPKDV